MRKQTASLALCGVLCGLSVVVLSMSALFPSLSYVIPMVAGALLIVPSIEFGTRSALTSYAAVSVIGMLILPEKEAPLMYVFLFGLYPVIKKYFERIPRRVPEYLAKFAYFNAAAAAAVAIATFVLSIPLDDGSLGKWLIPAMLVLGNIAFLFYDYTLTLVVTLYVRRLQPMLRKALHIK